MKWPEYPIQKTNLKMVWIYGENDEQCTKVPHFHVIGKNFEFEVRIQHIYELNIWRTKFIDKIRNKNTWNERAKIKKSIQAWLNAQNKDLPVTNAEMIVSTWNQNNPSNRITQSYKL